ncbi:hypothetical protein EQP59_05170 [Ornithobacterium rhinotracheale]|uniref:Uncharacterized protein n=1 Tax=Ornithobacterium rhinotracheale TaxID=28251 RepID=A0A3R6AUE7_ORNRH|nr:hypothetical protein [Ornithobacterium rhinotracheale]QAR30770.1 hypothetical protein EQP59_05170 [Ornithobacterium rhinotracheale]
MKVKYLVSLFLFFYSYIVFAIGVTDWRQTTPGGNEMNNFNDISLVFKSGNTVDNIFKWYFYKDHIICIIVNSWTDNMEFSYAVIDESTEHVKLFKNEKEWKIYIENSKLKPTVWTRWYRGDWSIFNNIFSILYFLIPAIIFLLFLFRKSNSLLKKIMYIGFLILLLYYILNFFPQSI